MYGVKVDSQTYKDKKLCEECSRYKTERGGNLTRGLKCWMGSLLLKKILFWLLYYCFMGESCWYIKKWDIQQSDTVKKEKS